MDQYLAYLPQSEGFLPKWLFFVGSACCHPITTALFSKLTSNLSI
jgi:hypothetical protein